MTSSPRPVLTLRPLEKGDRVALYKCHQRNLSEVYPSSVWDMFVQDYTGTSYVISDHEKKDIYGFSVGSQKQIFSFAVDKEHRRQGWGRRLLEAVLGSVKISFPFTLQVRVSNHGALALYVSMGFVQAGVLPKYYDDGEDGLLMQHVGNKA